VTILSLCSGVGGLELGIERATGASVAAGAVIAIAHLLWNSGARGIAYAPAIALGTLITIFLA